MKCPKQIFKLWLNDSIPVNLVPDKNLHMNRGECFSPTVLPGGTDLALEAKDTEQCFWHYNIQRV